MVESEIGTAELCRLMAAYQGGDASAFDQLYPCLAPRLRRCLTGLTRDAASAEDLLQETFLRLHKARHTYDPDSPLLPWVYAIARHVFLMDRRRRRRAREGPLLVEDARMAVPPRARPWAADDVDRALGRLEREHRATIVLHHVWGFRFAEIAARLGITEGAARARAHRAMESMRRFLGWRVE